MGHKRATPKTAKEPRRSTMIGVLNKPMKIGFFVKYFTSELLGCVDLKISTQQVGVAISYSYNSPIMYKY